MGANTDKFIKANDKFSTTLASAIADGSTTASFDLALEPEDITDGEAVLLFIDRVDSDGVKTPNLKEVIIGIKNGVTISSTVRGVEGSGQEHSIGAVVEIILAETMWNRMIEGILAEHNQDGGHSADAIDAITEIASALKSGSDTTLITGTAGTNGYTAKWNTDGDLVDGYEVLDEDDMASDSDTALATQQSIKAYVDSLISAISTDASRVYLASNQSLSDSTYISIGFASEDFDTNTLHSTSVNNSRITIKTTGKYIITGCVGFASNATGKRIVRIIKNGATVLQYAGQDAQSSGNTDISIAVIASLTATDYVEIQGYQSSGGSLDAIAGNDRTHFEIHQLS